MVNPRARSVISPRFWLEPKYEALFRDADGMAFEFRGSGVKAMTEEDYVNSTGNIQHSGKASPAAKKWADTMTEKYPELAVADPIFGQLQNCMELAVVGASIVKEDLPRRADYSMTTLLDTSTVKTDAFNVPNRRRPSPAFWTRDGNRSSSPIGRGLDQLLGDCKQDPAKR